MNVFITDRAAGYLREHYGPKLEGLSSRHLFQVEPAGADLDSPATVPATVDAVVCDYHEWAVRLQDTEKPLVVADVEPTGKRGADFIKLRDRRPLDYYCGYSRVEDCDCYTVEESLDKIEAALSRESS